MGPFVQQFCCLLDSFCCLLDSFFDCCTVFPFVGQFCWTVLLVVGQFCWCFQPICWTVSFVGQFLSTNVVQQFPFVVLVYISGGGSESEFPEFSGVRWSSWSSQESAGVRRSSLKFAGVLRSLLEYPGVRWSPLEFPGVFWSSTEFREFAGIPWSSLE